MAITKKWDEINGAERLKVAATIADTYRKGEYVVSDEHILSMLNSAQPATIWADDDVRMATESMEAFRVIINQYMNEEASKAEE